MGILMDTMKLEAVSKDNVEMYSFVGLIDNEPELQYHMVFPDEASKKRHSVHREIRKILNENADFDIITYVLSKERLEIVKYLERMFGFERVPFFNGKLAHAETGKVFEVFKLVRKANKNV